MAKYEELRRLTAERVRTLCICKGWYTRGTIEQYTALLNKVSDMEESEKGNTTDQLGEIAEDILRHSDTNYTVEGIMWELNRAANTTFYIVRN
jgi:hypothetical protein